MKSYRTSRVSMPLAGVTLSEVLVSMLVMSLGVISVFTLFPIALLRSVQATQLSNATILRQNAEARVEFDPETVHGAYAWSSNWNTSSILDPVWVTPTLPTTKDWRRNNPSIVFLRTGGGTTTDTSSNPPPSWNSTLGAVTNDNTVSWRAWRIQNYLVDPIGCREWANLGVSGNNIAFLGGSLSNLARMDGRAYDSLTADAIAGLPDAWIPVFSSVLAATAVDNTGSMRITIPNPEDLASFTPRNYSNPNGVEYRALLFDETGKYAVKNTIYVMDSTGGYLYWNDTTAPSPSNLQLPLNFNATKLQVDARESRYSWMLTVRKRTDGMAAVDVVVFFNRSFQPGKDELVYDNSTGSVQYSVNNSGNPPAGAGYGPDGQPGVAGFDDDGNGAVDDSGEFLALGSDDDNDDFLRQKRTIIVTWASVPDPFLKKGGFVLDARLGNWYRIQDYSYVSGSGTATLVVDHDLVPMPSGTSPALVFFRGVVEVYPLGLRIAL